MARRKASGFGARLKKAAGNWDEQKDEVREMSGFVDLPNGNYIGRLIEGEIKEDKNGNLGMLTKFVVEEGDYEDETHVVWNSLERNEDSFKWAALHLQQLGADVDDIEPETIEEVLKELVEGEPRLRFKLSQNGEYQNFRISQLLDSDDEEEAEEEEYEEEAEEEESEEEEAEEEEESEDDSYTPAKGDRVYTDEYGEDEPATVTSTVKSRQVAKVKFDDGETGEYPWDEVHLLEDEESEEPEEEEESEEDEVDPVKGDTVVFEKNGKETEGKVTAVLKGGKVKVKPDGSRTQITLSVDDVEVIAEEEEED